jgi:hypothetical protein
MSQVLIADIQYGPNSDVPSPNKYYPRLWVHVPLPWYMTRERGQMWTNVECGHKGWESTSWESTSVESQESIVYWLIAQIHSAWIIYSWRKGTCFSSRKRQVGQLEKGDMFQFSQVQVPSAKDSYGRFATCESFTVVSIDNSNRILAPKSEVDKQRGTDVGIGRHERSLAEQWRPNMWCNIPHRRPLAWLRVWRQKIASMTGCIDSRAGAQSNVIEACVAEAFR